MADAGYAVAFTVDPGVASRRCNRHGLPRVEVLAADEPFKLRLKLATAAWPQRWRTPLLRLCGVTD